MELLVAIGLRSVTKCDFRIYTGLFKPFDLAVTCLYSLGILTWQ